ncbi:hypothetical protein [Allosphingosinicella vermicomposti]|uniref:hypothetical protein n=1 Tax=Allosphingosinicella vermicomposti TaxID=614671 RepID=UPI000D0F89DA|nr:hypothetical protein [Allosphingosinicella vermicomposti]
MLRTLLLAGAATFAVPALAQVTTDGEAAVQTPGTMTEMEMEANVTPDHTMSLTSTTSTITQHDRATTSATSHDMSTMNRATQAEMNRPAQADTNMAQSMPRDPMLTGMGGPLNIESNWGRFDAGSKGYLTPLEFGEWVMETNGQNMSAAIDKTLRSRASGIASVQVLNNTAGALAQVDSNHDWRVSRDELASIAE